MKVWMQDPVLQLFTGALLVLALATTIGSILSIRIAKGKPHAVIDNLNNRIFAWWWMVGLLGASFACGKSRRHRAVRGAVVLRAARVHHAGLHAPRRPHRTRGQLLHRVADSSTR